MNESRARKTLVVCDLHPVAIEGMRSLIAQCADLRFAGSAATLLSGIELVRMVAPTLLLLDKSFGIGGISDLLTNLRSGGGTSVVIWGVAFGEAETFRLLKAGAQGVISKTADVASMMNCLRTVTSGNTWVDEGLSQEIPHPFTSKRRRLTVRERQVADLVEKGWKNKEIGQTLGIQTGTVKIHVRHIFEKTGARGRYHLALAGLEEKGFLSIPSM